MKEFKRILIIRTDRMGDVILSVPVISNLRRVFPESYIAFMCRPYTRALLEGNPDLNEVIVYDKYGTHKSFLATWRFARDLKRKNFDLALILHPTNRAHLIAFGAGIKTRIGWDRNLSRLLTEKVPHLKSQGKKHESEYTLDILRALELEVREMPLVIPVKDSARRSIGEILKKKGIDEAEEFVVVHPSASCPSKRWKQRSFAALIKKIRQNLHLPVVVTTAETEKEFAAVVAREEGVVDLRGMVSLFELIALLERAKLFVSNDSGPVHIAAALGTPVISIFGRSDPGLSPTRWRPLGENSFFIHKNVDCPVCRAHDCQKNFLCLDSISPDEVYALIEKILAKE